SARRADASGLRVIAVRADVASPQGRRSIVRAVRRLGRLDLLVQGASTLAPSPLPPLLDCPIDEFRHVLETNVVAPIALAGALVKDLSKSRGMIVNLTSDAALGGYPGWGAYGASKAALDLASKTLAAELNPRGISVVAVDPGDMRT